MNEPESRSVASKEDGAEVLNDVLNERRRQLGDWGTQEGITRERWLSIMMEELGEASAAELERTTIPEKRKDVKMTSREELIQLAATVLRALEVWVTCP